MGQISLQIPQVGQPNGTEDARIASDFTTLQALVNGNLDTTNFASGAVEPAFSTYKDLPHWVNGSFTSSGASTLLLPHGNVGMLAAPAAATSFVIYLNPSDWTAGSRTTKLRLRAILLTDAVAPAINYIYSLYPVATWGGASGSSATIATLGTIVAGSSVTFTSPSANSQLQSVSADFGAPTAGFYVIAVTTSGPAAAGGQTVHAASLQMRQV